MRLEADPLGEESLEEVQNLHEKEVRTEEEQTAAICLVVEEATKLDGVIHHVWVFVSREVAQENLLLLLLELCYGEVRRMGSCLHSIYQGSAVSAGTLSCSFHEHLLFLVVTVSMTLQDLQTSPDVFEEVIPVIVLRGVFEMDRVA